jgi:hypothetical protein
MPLSSGTRLGSYEEIASLGARSIAPVAPGSIAAAGNDRGMPSIARAASVLIVILSCAGCERTPPTSPTPKTGSSVPPAPIWIVSGTVWIAGGSGLEPATRGDVFGWIDSGAPGETEYATREVPISVDGHYELTIPAGTERLRLRGPLFQPCVITLEPTGDAIADIQVVRDESMLGAHLPAGLNRMEPTLSGVAYETTSLGPKPLDRVAVSLDTNSGGAHVIARTVTDAEGRYVLCGVPSMPGLTIVAGLDGFDSFVSSGDLNGRSVLDLELRRK